MIIKSIHLKNIRSYKDQKIKFNKGITLLQGDIGSGKSSILYALDFALFGLKKSDSSKLLRHGETRAEVELEIELDKKNILISRAIEKKRDRIQQTRASIAINNSYKTLSPTMLNHEIKSILGYNTNSREEYSPFYYTVYTPQESMKEILMSKKEDRLRIIRDIFQIDKYQKIKNNTSLFISHLNYIINYLRGQTSNIKELEKEIKNREKEADEIKESIKELLKEESIKKDNLKKTESEIKKRNELETKKQSIEKKISQIQGTLKTLSYNIENITKKINSQKKELSEKNAEEIKNKITQKKKELEDIKKQLKILPELREELIEKTKKIAEHNSKIKDFKETIQKISNLNTCPLCLQNVSNEHKHTIESEQTRKIANFTKINQIFIKEKQKIETQISALEQKNTKEKQLIREISELENQLNNIKTIRESIDYLEKQKQETLNKELEHKKNLSLYTSQLSQIMSDLKNYSEIETLYKIATKEFHEIHTKLKIQQNNLNNLNSIIQEKTKELNDKLKKSEELERLMSINNWLNSIFIELISTIEKHVLGRIYREFNILFRNWFSILVDDDNIQASIDEYFSPSITQNNYEMNYNFLSGGEKTAVALAYRLAINKAVNTLADNIKTKDLLILDEPTEGFSTEQLDRVRDVLLSLNLSQIILVSHEQKMQTIADHTIKLIKINGITKIVGDNNF